MGKPPRVWGGYSIVFSHKHNSGCQQQPQPFRGYILDKLVQCADDFLPCHRMFSSISISKVCSCIIQFNVSNKPDENEFFENFFKVH